MTKAVDILVPKGDLATVRRALGKTSAVRVGSQLLRGWTPRVVVASVRTLATSRGCVEVESLVRAHTKAGPIPLVLLGYLLDADAAATAGAVRLSHQIKREPYVAPDGDALRRLVAACERNATGELIASATLEDGQLIVWSCEPRRYEVAVAEIPSLAELRPNVLRNFQVSPSGSRIHWLAVDVDVNLDTIRERADPVVRRAHEAASRKEAARYAGAIRKLREHAGLKQTDIAGLSERQVRRLEEGRTTPRAETLRKLAAAHGLAVNEYLAALATSTISRPSRARTTGPHKGRSTSSVLAKTLPKPGSKKVIWRRRQFTPQWREMAEKSA